jgi:hypothetical protein
VVVAAAAPTVVVVQAVELGVLNLEPMAVQAVGREQRAVMAPEQELPLVVVAVDVYYRAWEVWELLLIMEEEVEEQGVAVAPIQYNLT